MSEKQDIFDRIMQLPGLRIFNGFYTRNKSVLMYLFFGGLTTLISIVVFMFFDSYIKLNVLTANIISWICAVSFAYGTNRRWVFNSTAAGHGLLKEMLSFFAGRLATLGLEEALLFIFVSLLHFNSTLVKIIAQLVVLISNYIISKLFVFKNGNRRSE